MRDAGDRLAERGELLGLQQLMIEIARLILEALAIADVAHQRFDAQTVAAALGVRGHLHPHRRLVGAAQAKQVVADRAVVLETAEEAVARLRIDETLELERTHLVFRRPRRQSRTSVSGEGWRRASGSTSPLTVPM